MDKYDKIFDLIKHPEKYSSDEVSDLLSNPEMKEIVGISVCVSISDNKSKTSETELSTTNVNQMVASCDTVASKVNDQKDKSSPVIFEDTPLEDILMVVSEQYDVSVKFRNPAKAEIHLFYKFDSSKQLEDIIEQLNTFERISISIDGNTIIIE